MDHIYRASVMILSVGSHCCSGPHSLRTSVTILSAVSFHFGSHIPHTSVTILSTVSLHRSGPHSLRASVMILSAVSHRCSRPYIPHASVPILSTVSLHRSGPHSLCTSIAILSTVSLHSGFCVVIQKHSVLIYIHHTIGDLVDGYLCLMGGSHWFKKLHNKR